MEVMADQGFESAKYGKGGERKVTLINTRLQPGSSLSPREERVGREKERGEAQ
jgi:hypothetical protein